jgi:hypothetical protein
MPLSAFTEIFKALANLDGKNEDKSWMDTGTLRYIWAYKKGVKTFQSQIPGLLPPIIVAERLYTACSDWSFSLEEIQQMTLLEMAMEVNSRGIWRPVYILSNGERYSHPI